MDKPTIKILLDYCDSDDLDRQAEAIIELVDAKVYAAAPKIVKLLKSSDPAIRSTAAYALGYLGIQELETFGAALIDSIVDPEDIVRSEAIEALGGLSYTPAIDSIKYLLIHDPSPLVRASAAEALGELGLSEALETLELSLVDFDEDDAVRSYAANSIGLLGTPQLLPKLETYIKAEKSPAVKAELRAARYWLGAKEEINFIVSLLDNADEDFATHILNILTDLKERKMPSLLTKDAPDIGKGLRAIAQRFPILRPHTEQLMAQ